MNLKVEIIRKKKIVRGVIRSPVEIPTNDRITRVVESKMAKENPKRNSRIYFQVNEIKELENYFKYGNVELAMVQMGNLLFSLEEVPKNPFENSLENDEDFLNFSKNPSIKSEVDALPLDTNTTPLLEALKEKKLQKLQKSVMKKELYQPKSITSQKSNKSTESLTETKKKSKKKSNNSKITLVKKD